MKGSRSAYCGTISAEIRNGHLTKDRFGKIAIGDLSDVRNRYSYPGFPNDVDRAIMDYLKEHPASSTIEIGDGIGYTVGTVAKHLKRMGARKEKNGSTYYWSIDDTHNPPKPEV